MCYTMIDFRITWTLWTSKVRKPRLLGGGCIYNRMSGIGVPSFYSRMSGIGVPSYRRTKYP